MRIATEKCLEEMYKHVDSITIYHELSCTEDKILRVANSLPDDLRDEFCDILDNIKEYNRDISLEQCTNKLIYNLPLSDEIMGELLKILFGVA